MPQVRQPLLSIAEELCQLVHQLRGRERHAGAPGLFVLVDLTLLQEHTGLQEEENLGGDLQQLIRAHARELIPQTVLRRSQRLLTPVRLLPAWIFTVDFGGRSVLPRALEDAFDELAKALESDLRGTLPDCRPQGIDIPRALPLRPLERDEQGGPEIVHNLIHSPRLCQRIRLDVLLGFASGFNSHTVLLFSTSDLRPGMPARTTWLSRAVGAERTAQRPTSQ